MRKLLVISYFYPPYSCVGATRVSKLTRYLADVGWESHVLTVDRSDLPPTLPVEIPDSRITRVAQRFDLAAAPRLVLGRRRLTTDRVLAVPGWKSSLIWRSGELYRHLVCLPDAQIGWRGPAVAAGLRLIDEIRPDAILSSSLPNTSHLVARVLARKRGLPWVAELRDLWTRNHNFRRVQPLRAIEERLERRVLSDADALVTVSEVWTDLLRRMYGRPAAVVPNGYDPLDYPSGAMPARDRFTLAYTGMLYNGKQNAGPLFEAVARLAAAGRIAPDRFRIEFVGPYLGQILADAEAHGVLTFTSVGPPVSYAESLRLQSGATALLFLDWFAAGAQGWYSAKIYEYLGAGRPVLSIGPRNTVVARLLERTGAGVACPTAADVAATIDAWLREFEAHGAVAYRADENVRTQFQRQQAARLMADVLDRVVAARSPAGPHVSAA